MTKNIKDIAIERYPNWQKIELYDILYEYFSESEAFTKRGFNLDKGILLVGGVGTGKTTAMELYQDMLKGSNKFFKYVNSRHIIRDYRIEGEKVIDIYGRKSFSKKEGGQDILDFNKPITLYIDDLGHGETSSKQYGNESNVMADIMLDRYENFKKYGQKTHASTNLDANQIEAVFGARLRDRIKEMCNIINVTGSSFRK